MICIWFPWGPPFLTLNLVKKIRAEAEKKGIKRALGLDLFTRYGAKVVFKAATLVVAGILIMVTLSRWGPPQATSTITITNREAGHQGL